MRGCSSTSRRSTSPATGDLSEPLEAGRGADELGALGRLAGLLAPAPEGEVWIGDDAAVLRGEPGPILFATDLVAEGVHFERSTSSLADVGWRVLTANVSDIAAMGAVVRRAVVAVAGAWGDDLDALYEGLTAAAERYGCPLVGGDLSAAPLGGGLVVSVAVLGSADGCSPVLRSGGRPDDRVFVTGPLGGSAAGLAALQRVAALGRGRVGGSFGPSRSVLEPPDPETATLWSAHLRPIARQEEGRCAARLGASAMIDVSDGLGLDLDRLCRASGVGVVLDRLACTIGASPEEALGGGEDYELVFSTPPERDVAAAFAGAGLREPIEIGRLVEDRNCRLLEGVPFPIAGYRHDT